MNTDNRTALTPTEVCTLVAHETVTLLDTVQTELPQCVGALRAALAALTTLHDLGRDGETLLAWVDTEIANAEKFVADGTNLPNLIDTCQVNTVPDAVTQMEVVWTLFGAAAMEGCGPEQRRALLNTARTLTEMCGLDDLLLATLKPNTAELAEGLRTELDDLRATMHTSPEPVPEPAM